MEGKDKAQELMEIWLEESSSDYKSLMAYYECADIDRRMQHVHDLRS